MRTYISMVAVVMTLLLSGCSRSSAPVPVKPPPAEGGKVDVPAATQPGPLPAPDDTAKAGIKAVALFPAADLQMEFQVWEIGRPTSDNVQEQILRDGDRAIVIYAGKPYFTWLMDDAGVWRKDPWGGGALLRYLPATLQNGLIWKQKSGGDTIWFQLTQESDLCPTSAGRGMPDDKCWTLTVLRPGEQLSYRFAEGYGPTLVRTVNTNKPGDSFYKEILEHKTDGLPAADRKAFIDKAPPVDGARAKVETANENEFSQARIAYLGLKTIEADVGSVPVRVELRGLFDTFTLLPVEILSQDGKRLGLVKPWDREAQKVTPIQFASSKQTYLEIITRMADRAGYATIAFVRSADSNQGWWVDGAYGWDAKAIRTPASRITTAKDGLVTVEWDLGDPARHTRVRRYRLSTNGERPGVTLESEAFRPEGQELVYPTDPLDVLRAAWVARWLPKLLAEVPRYFAHEPDARAFMDDKRIQLPNYEPGDVRFTAVTAKGADCRLTTAPASLGTGTTVAFLANWGGYEWGSVAWGTVTFGKDAQGRTVIEHLTISDVCGSGV